MKAEKWIDSPAFILLPIVESDQARQAFLTKRTLQKDPTRLNFFAGV